MDTGRPTLTGFRKRQQIAKANKTIFVWVLGASIVIAMSGVGLQFMIRQGLFNQKIISKKSETQKMLDDNITNAKELVVKIDSLVADPNLAKARAGESDTGYKVVLDALPTVNDPAALGASLQNAILPRSGVAVSELTTVSSDQAAEETVASESGSAPTATFSYVANGTYDQLRTMLSDVERTIRPIVVKQLSYEAVEGSVKVTVQGETYYQLNKSASLTMKKENP